MVARPPTLDPARARRAAAARRPAGGPGQAPDDGGTADRTVVASGPDGLELVDDGLDDGLDDDADDAAGDDDLHGLGDDLDSWPGPRTARVPRGARPALRLTAQQRVRRSATLLLLGLLVPGTPQLVAGDRRVGRVAVRTWIGLLVPVLLLGLLWVVDRGLVLGVVTRPSVLTVAALVCIGVGIAWPLLLLDAWRLGRPGELPLVARRWVAGATVVLLLVTSVPLVMAGRRLWAAADLVGGVFGGNEAAGTSAGRYNVLLLGGDAGSDRVGLRPDSVTLASIDASTGRTVLFSFPRNMQNIPFPPGTPAAKALPNGWSCGDQCLLNAVYTWGTQHPNLFPGAKDPGAEAMKQAVSGITGLSVSYYVLVDLSGFRRLVDAMGGIDLTVKTRVPIGGGTSKVIGYIEPGRRHLNGWRALWYARSREGSSDYERMQRQRCVMTAMAAQMDPTTLLARFQSIAAAGKEIVSTDVPASDLGTFLDLGMAGRSRTLTSVQFVPPIVTPAHPDFALVRTRVKQAISAAEKDDVAWAKAQDAAARSVTASAKPSAEVSAKPSAKASAPSSAKPSAKASAKAQPAAKASTKAPLTGTSVTGGGAVVPRSPSAPGTDTAAGGTDVSTVCSV